MDRTRWVNTHLRSTCACHLNLDHDRMHGLGEPLQTFTTPTSEESSVEDFAPAVHNVSEARLEVASRCRRPATVTTRPPPHFERPRCSGSLDAACRSPCRGEVRCRPAKLRGESRRPHHSPSPASGHDCLARRDVGELLRNRLFGHFHLLTRGETSPMVKRDGIPASRKRKSAAFTGPLTWCFLERMTRFELATLTLAR